MYLFHPQIEKTIDLIKEGEIGEVLSMETNFGNNILTKKNWFGFVKKKDEVMRPHKGHQQMIMMNTE